MSLTSTQRLLVLPLYLTKTGQMANWEIIISVVHLIEEGNTVGEWSVDSPKAVPGESGTKLGPFRPVLPSILLEFPVFILC